MSFYFDFIAKLKLSISVYKSVLIVSIVVGESSGWESYMTEELHTDYVTSIFDFTPCVLCMYYV